MFRYRLRTLLVLMAIGPLLLWVGWARYQTWKTERERQERLVRARREWLDLLGVLPPVTELRKQAGRVGTAARPDPTPPH